MPKVFKFLPVLIALMALPSAVSAQIDQQCPHIAPLLAQQERQQRSRGNIREQLVKLCIKENKKDFEKLVERTEQIAKLTDEIKTSFDETQSLSAEDEKEAKRGPKTCQKSPE